jgi:SWIM zinc finger
MARVRGTITIRVPAHITLARVESDAPGRFYEIAFDPQNLVFCTCEAWRYFGHTCKHLKAFRTTLAKAVA